MHLGRSIGRGGCGAPAEEIIAWTRLAMLNQAQARLNADVACLIPAGSRFPGTFNETTPGTSGAGQRHAGVASVLRRGLGYSRPELAAVRQAQLAAGVEPVG
jgi:hypothetical protein